MDTGVVISIALSAVTLGVASYGVALQRRADRRQTADMNARSDVDFDLAWENLPDGVSRMPSSNAIATLAITLTNKGARVAENVRVEVLAPSMLELRLLGEPGVVDHVGPDIGEVEPNFRPLLRHRRLISRLVSGPETVRAEVNFMAQGSDIPVEVVVRCEDQPEGRMEQKKRITIRHEQGPR